MSTLNPNGRRFYQRTGNVNWVRFLPWMFAAFLVSGILACLLNLAIHSGFYFIIIIPMLAGLIMGGTLFLAVQGGHCRSRMVAGICGALMGTSVYLGYFHAGLVGIIGIQNIARVDLLPRYIQFRMNSDQIRHDDRPNVTGYRSDGKKRASADDEETPAPDGSPIQSLGHWCLFAMEFGLILFLACGFAIGRAKKAYCERCQDWMEQELATFLPELGRSFLDAFNKGQVSFITASRKVPVLQRMPYTGVAIDYCSAAARGRSECPVYLSIKDIKIANVFGSGQLGKFDSAQGKVALDRVELIPEEASSLSACFPVLSSVAHVRNPSLAATTSADPSIVPAFQPVAPVKVKLLPLGCEGKVLIRQNIILGNLITFGNLGAFFAGLAGIFGGIYFLIPAGSASPQSSAALRVAAGILFIIIGGVTTMFVSFVLFRNPGVLSNRRYRTLTRRSFKSRSECWMDWDHAEAIFVEIVPRKNWGRMMLETAEDIGFLRIDRERQEVLFEGDRECYRIPAGAIISCDIEEIVLGHGETGNVIHYMTVIRAHRGTIVWEACIAQRWTGWTANNNTTRWARANEMKQRILSLISAVAASS
jgi:hypothetical protein